MASTANFSVVVMGLVCVLAYRVSGNGLPCTMPDKGVSFQVFIGPDEVTDFPCALYGSSSCTNFSTGFWTNGLGDGDSVNKPREFAATLFQTPEVKNETCSGLSFTWRVPPDEISRKNTKGYFLRLAAVGSSKTICRSFDLQELVINSSKTHFKFEMSPMKQENRYLVDLFSMPPPSPQEIEENLFQRLVISIPKCVNHSKPPFPADWTTWLAVRNPKNGMVEIQFGLPSDRLGYGFTSYIVRLFVAGESNHKAETVVQHSNTGNGLAVFENIPSGQYTVQVKADDPFYQNPQRCLCNRGKKEFLDAWECAACARTESAAFNVTGKAATAPPHEPATSPSSLTAAPAATPTGPPLTATGPASLPPTGASSVHGPRVDAGAIAGAVIGALAVALVAASLVLLFCVTCRRKQKRGDMNKKGWAADAVFPAVTEPGVKPNKTGSAKNVWTTDTNYNSLVGSELKAVPTLKRKQIFLLTAEDHPFHIAAVEQFAQFLRVHCQCDVTFAPQCRSELRGKIIYCWMSGEIQSADFVVLVTSKAALCLYQAFQKGLAYREADLGPEGDLFTPAIQHICGLISCNTDVQKVVMVHFDHTSSDCRLPIGALPSSLYSLPKHLGDFLKHIHGLNCHSNGLSKVLPLQCDVGQLNEGNDWLAAIQEARAFERRCPNWFEEKFGTPTEVLRSGSTIPSYTTQESGFYSHEGGSIGSRNSAELQRKLSSVSMRAEDLFSPYENSGVHEPVFTKDDFFEPSMVFSTYTVPPGSAFDGGKVPDEVDDRHSTTSEQLRRLNQRYELLCQEEMQESAGPAVYDKPSASVTPKEHVHFAVEGGITLKPQYITGEDEDCISIASAQSV